MHTSFDLTPLEKQVLVLLAEDYDTKDIMLNLHISESYANYVVRLLKVKLNTKTRSGIVARAIAQGLLATPVSGASG